MRFRIGIGQINRKLFNANCFCSIRKCAREKKVDVCVFCQEYPCERLLGVAKGYPTLIADGKRMKEIGIEAWVQEQKERA